MQALTSIFKGLGRLFLQPIFLILLLLVVSGGGVYLFTQNRSITNELSSLRGTPGSDSQEEIEELLGAVGQLIELPEGEQPTIATVTDAESLRDQSFFENAQNGDRVLIYTDARRAVLYRPDVGKIIEVAPINIGEAEGLEQGGEGSEVESDGAAEENNEEVQEQVTGPVRLALSNGTDVAGLTVTASDDLEATLVDVELDVVSRTDAEENYDTTVVVALSEGFSGAADSIATAVGGAVGDLPEGESTPDADVLVILGSDYTTE